MTLPSSPDGDADDIQERSPSPESRKVRKRASVQSVSSLRVPHACTQPLPLAPRTQTQPLELVQVPNMCINNPW